MQIYNFNKKRYSITITVSFNDCFNNLTIYPNLLTITLNNLTILRKPKK